MRSSVRRTLVVCVNCGAVFWGSSQRVHSASNALQGTASYSSHSSHCRHCRGIRNYNHSAGVMEGGLLGFALGSHLAVWLLGG